MPYFSHTYWSCRVGMGVALLGAATALQAEVRVVVGHHDNDHASSAFSFPDMAGPSRSVVGDRYRFVIVDGQADANSGGLRVLTDGRLPEEPDAPLENFFFNAATPGGRILLDLAAPTELIEVRTFSWHPGSRGPQVYSLYASDGAAAGFDARPSRPTQPESVGWKLLAKVDTRSADAQIGGQYAVRVSESGGKLGAFRYLLFDIAPTETADAFGNTFYSEIMPVVEQSADTNAPEPDCTETFKIGDGVYRVTLDTCDTPDLQPWARTVLEPVVGKWYPKLVALLPSDGFIAPKDVTIRFSERMRGVAATSGHRVTCAAKWFRANLQGEAVGAVVHELVHVVQQYGNARRTNPNARPAPGWLVEGIADYLRWFVYEPESHGADLVWLRKRANLQLRYDAGYRITANFLDWVSQKHDPNIVRDLNVALRNGTYEQGLWQQWTGQPLDALAAEWSKQTSEALNR